jgi:DNA-binding beta-propeller fold protein YncE
MKKAFFIFSAILVTCATHSIAQSNYKPIKKISVEGDGGWDLLTVDESTGRLFLSHKTVVQVVDVKSGKLLGTIPDTKGVHGITLANDLNKGYISNGKDSSVTIFDLKTLTVLKKVQVTGLSPDAILYDAFTHNVFVYNAKTSNATVIDAKTDKIVSTIPFIGNPELSVNDGKGKVYVNIEDKSKVCVINSGTLKIEHTWDLAPGEEPTGIAIDKENSRLFIACANKLMVILDATTGHLITSLPIGEGVDGAAFDPIKKRAYSSNGDGTLTVIQEADANTFSVLENVRTQKGARTIAIDSKTHHVYLPTADFGPTPEPTAENPHPRATLKPGSFVVLDIEPEPMK